MLSNSDINKESLFLTDFNELNSTLGSKAQEKNICLIMPVNFSCFCSYGISLFSWGEGCSSPTVSLQANLPSFQKLFQS